MGKSTFSGPIRTGKDYGNAVSANTLGTVQIIQRVTCTNGAKTGIINLPPDCEINDLRAYVRTAASAGGTPGVFIKVGTATDKVHYASFSTSAVGLYRPAATSAVALMSGCGTADQNPVYVVVSGQSSGSVLGDFDAITFIEYIQRS